MVPTRLTIENVGNFRGEHTLDLADISMAAVVGPNGAGKSSLVDAIIWTLFGDWRGSSADDVITRGERECRAALEFSADGQAYRVERARRLKGKAELHFQSATLGTFAWRPLDGNNMRETQARICERLRMTGDLLRATAFLGQEDASRFTRETPAGRKQVLFEVLGLERYLDWCEAAHRGCRAAEQDQAVVASTLHSVRAAAADLPDAEADVKRLVAAQDTERERVRHGEEQQTGLRREIEELAAQVASGDVIERALKELGRTDSDQAFAAQGTRGDIYRFEKQLRAMDSQSMRQLASRTTELETELADAEEAHRQVTSATAAYSHHSSFLDGETRAWKAQRAALEGEIKRAREQGQLLGRVPCKDTDLSPQCELLAAARRAQGAVDGLERQLRSKSTQAEAEDKVRRAAVAQAEAALTAAKSDTAGRRPADVIQQDVDRARNAAELLSSIKTTEARLADARERLPKLQAELAVTRKRMIEQREQLEALLPARGTLAIKRNTLEALERQLQQHRQACDHISEELGAARRRVEQARDAQERLPDLASQAASHERDREVYGFLVNAFGRDGIPADLLDQALPALEQEANQLLALLSDGRLSLRLDTQRQKAAGGLMETLDVLVAGDGIERDYATFSGGERMRIDLALRLGLSRLLAQRANAKCGLLVLDETLAPLDDAGRQQSIECLAKLRDLFPKILLVTHLDELRDAFPTTISVERTGQGSSITIQ